MLRPRTSLAVTAFTRLNVLMRVAPLARSDFSIRDCPFWTVLVRSSDPGPIELLRSRRITIISWVAPEARVAAALVETPTRKVPPLTTRKPGRQCRPGENDPFATSRPLNQMSYAPLVKPVLRPFLLRSRRNSHSMLEAVHR